MATSSSPLPRYALAAAQARFATLNLNNPFSRHRDILLFHLPLILPYLSKKDLWCCCTLNHTWGRAAKQVLWSYPIFGGDTTTSLNDFRTFLQCIEFARDDTLALIRVIDVADVEETMYDTIEGTWLRTIVTRCPNLHALILRKAEFLNSRAVRFAGVASNRSVQYLDASFCRNLTEVTIKQLANLFPSLKTLKFDQTSGINDASVSQLVYSCDEVQHLSLGSARNLTDTGLYAIAKFCKIRLRSIDITSNVKITDAGILAIARFCIHLERLTLTSCVLLTDVCITGIAKATARTLTHLDITNCKGLRLDLPVLYTLANSCHKLDNLALSFSTLNRDHTHSKMVLEVFHEFRSLRHLILHDIPEHTPIKFVADLVHQMENGALKQITLYRDYYTSDFIMGGYTDLRQTASPVRTMVGSASAMMVYRSPDVTSREVEKFNESMKGKVVVRLLEKKELLPTVAAEQW
ncbi:hypothetical protein BC938DRAFT_483297 [Jimgerdemannia flammicorona]|uniref:F-box/LRR-repeat protein 15-like leucin rich repeat domain-containing protein n=1 Tax=Jimgerdemannia flammicorona TaxID=994334 RepID=A0A433QVR5_9FUNG|nr:hypothetical protein BC938DRAFT_483297 [Jimgerdemannia flammicorona]